MLNSRFRKITIPLFFGAVLLAVGVLYGSNPQSVHAATSPIYQYSSVTQNEFNASKSLTTNLVYEDNASTQSFTLNASSFTDGSPDVSMLGGSKYLTLTGTANGQFVYGSPTIQSLTTTTNLTANRFLYAIRTRQDIDLTYYKDITVNFGWAAGGSNKTFSAFLAKSSGGDSESWSVMGNVKVNVALSTAGTLSFTDTTNTVLMGGSWRFAIVIGSTSGVSALKNFTFGVAGSLRTTLDSLSNLSFTHIGNHVVGESIYHSEVLFTANYSYRVGGNAVDLNGGASGTTIRNVGDLVNYSDPFSYSSPGTYSFKVTYQDPSGFGTKNSTLTFTIVAVDKTLTGIYAADSASHAYYQYQFFAPTVNVYPLFDGETTPSVGVLPLQDELYTCSVNAASPLKNAFNATWNYVFEPGKSFTSNSISYTVANRTLTSLDLTGYQDEFSVNDPFSLGGLVVTSHWNVGPDAVIPYSSMQKDGYYTTALAVGTSLSEKGPYTNTISYYAFGAENPASYSYSVNYGMSTFFEYFFSSGDLVFGATTSVQNGLLSNTTTLTNAVALGSNVSHTLTTSTNVPGGNEADYSLATYGLLLGSNGKGPQTVTIATTEVARATLNGVAHMAISILRIDLTTTSVGSVSATVAGVSPERYQIDGEAIVTASSAPTKADGASHTYLFYLPYVVIGKAEFVIMNNATPTPIEIRLFAYAGSPYSPHAQAEAFADMLNACNSCLEETYTDFLPTYDYLVSTGASSFLSTNILSNQGGLDAASLWSIITERFDNPSSKIYVRDAWLDENTSTMIAVVSLVAISVMGFFVLRNKRKAKGIF
jgi:hypothetical protein